MSSAGFEAGNYARVSINNVPVKVELNASGHDRGVHIVVINKSNFEILAAKVFDTYKSSVGLKKFMSEEIPVGAIVVAACKDECTTALTWETKRLFATMGSMDIMKLKYRQAFVFIGTKGIYECREKRAMRPEGQLELTQIFQINT